MVSGEMFQSIELSCADQINAAAGKAGAVEAVTAALKLHATNAAVAEQACAAICTLCINGEQLSSISSSIVVDVDAVVN
jgi:hypothetical protein